MKSRLFFFALFAFFSSCKTLPNSDKQFETIDKTKVYHLKLDPKSGSQYTYEITNQTNIKLEVNDNKIENANKTELAVNYIIQKDSIGNLVMNMRYDKIKITTKSGDTETIMDADNGALGSAADKMLSVFKTATITAEVSPSGEVKSVSGYKELTEKIMKSLNAADAYTRSNAQQQWEQFANKGLVKSNLDQLFKIFPDSAVHVGDKWKLDISQGDELGLLAKSSFQLKEIHDSIAVISSVGDIKSDNQTVSMMGQVVTTNLNGQQEGEYEINARTGMLINSSIKAKVAGTIQVMGKEIPIQVSSSNTMKGTQVH